MRRLAFILSLYLFIGFGKTGAQQLILKNYAWQGDSVRQAVKIVPPIYLFIVEKEQFTVSSRTRIDGKHHVAKSICFGE